MKLVCCFFAALRVHISPDTKVILDQLGGYKLVERGPITMKVGRHMFCSCSAIGYIKQSVNTVQLCLCAGQGYNSDVLSGR
jgi:hypothetical protein